MIYFLKISDNFDEYLDDNNIKANVLNLNLDE